MRLTPRSSTIRKHGDYERQSQCELIGAHVGRNKSAQFRHGPGHDNYRNSCRNGADLFRPTFGLVRERESHQLETARFFQTSEGIS